MRIEGKGARAHPEQDRPDAHAHRGEGRARASSMLASLLSLAHFAQMWGCWAIHSSGLWAFGHGTSVHGMMAFMSTMSDASSKPVVEAQGPGLGAVMRLWRLPRGPNLSKSSNIFPNR
jgi:hypothetical protein